MAHVKFIQMNKLKLAQITWFAGALTFAACNNPMGGEDDYAVHDHTVDEQVDAALDSLEQAGDEIGEKAEALGDETKSIFEEAKEGLKAGIKKERKSVVWGQRV